MRVKAGARGKLARLEALEVTAARRQGNRQAANWARITQAHGLLSVADRLALEDGSRVMEGGKDPEGLARMRRAVAHLPEDLPVSDPAKEEAEAWADRVWASPDGAALLTVASERVGDFMAYFGTCAAWCDREAARPPLSEDVHRLARWGAALWRFDAALCRVIVGAL